MKSRSSPDRRQIDAFRRFNRFYTVFVGLLNGKYLESDYCLSEVRVLYEIAGRPGAQAAFLQEKLGLDRGHLSRMLSRFERNGLLERSPSEADGRAKLLGLTPQGEAVTAELTDKARRGMGDILAPLAQRDRTRLLKAMREIEDILSTG